MTARIVPVSLSITDTDGITADLLGPGRVRIRLGADDASPWMYVSDVRVVDRLAGVLMDARRMLAPDDPASVVAVVPAGEVGDRVRVVLEGEVTDVHSLGSAPGMRTVRWPRLNADQGSLTVIHRGGAS